MTANTTYQSGRQGSLSGLKRQRSLKGHRRAIAVVALLPFVGFLVVFALYPLAELVRLSLADTRVEQGRFVSRWAGLENFGTALSDGAAHSSLLVTVVFVVLVVALTLVGGLGLALLVDRAVLLLGVARNVLIWPAIVAPVVVSVMWLLLLSPTAGGINKVLSTLGLPNQQWLNSELGAFLSIVAVDVWHWTPVVFLFMYTALKGLPHDVLEAARIDGASETQLFWRVILPLLMPAVIVVTLVRLIMSIKAFDEMYLLTRGGPDGATNLVSLHIRTMFFDRLEFGYAAALSISIVVVTAVVVGTVLYVRRGEPESGRS